MESAVPVARSWEPSTFTICELTGPTLITIRKQPMAVTVQMAHCASEKRMSATTGAAASVLSAQTRRCAVGLRRYQRSLQAPPTSVPTSPVTTVIPPKSIVAWSSGSPLAATRYLGSQIPTLPKPAVWSA